MLMPYNKINPKLTKGLNVTAKMIEFFKENIGVDLHDLGLCHGNLDMSPKTQANKKYINRTSSKFKTFMFQRKLLRK